jgi:multidrug efflux system membrane fusion protein
VAVDTRTGIDRQVCIVPTNAVQNSQAGPAIYVLKPDRTVELRPVKVARTDGETTVLVSGVRGGETVVTDGQLRLLPGMKAEPRTLSGAPTTDAPAPAKS